MEIVILNHKFNQFRCGDRRLKSQIKCLTHIYNTGIFSSGVHPSKLCTIDGCSIYLTVPYITHKNTWYLHIQVVKLIFFQGWLLYMYTMKVYQTEVIKVQYIYIVVGCIQKYANCMKVTKKECMINTVIKKKQFEQENNNQNATEQF